MTDDLSTRLLEAIERRERVAHLTDFDHENRICQAHREIVEMYDKAVIHERWLTANHIVAPSLGQALVLTGVIKVLASAYNLQEET